MEVIWVHDANFTLSLSPLKKRIAVFKEKASAMDADLFAKSKGQTQNCIFDAQIYSFLFFGISRKGFKKAGKALKTAPFVSFRAKA